MPDMNCEPYGSDSLTCTMKKIFLLIIISFSRTSYAQTWNEWFNQKKAQIQYLLGQVAANEIYIGYAEKGEKEPVKKESQYQ